MSTINVTNLSGRGGATPNLPDGANITGVATATTFSGTLDGSLKSTGTPTLGLGVTINASGVAVSGVLTATSYSGDGSGLTGVGESIAPWYYNPDLNDIDVTPQTGIGFTFNKLVNMGSGTATLKMVNAGVAGTTIQSWGITSVTKSAVTEFTLNSLVSPLTINKTYQLDIPEGYVVSSTGTNYAGTAYTFSVQGAERKFFSWGQGSDGRRDTNTTQNVSSPVQIAGTTWSQLTGGYYYAAYYALNTKTDGTLWSWGYDIKGELGISAATNAKISSPAQIPGTTWANARSGHETTTATKTDGTLWTWGENNFGQLGLNGPDNAKYSSPVQVPGTTWATGRFKMAGGSRWNAAIKTDGTLWMLGGEDDVGELAQNNNANFSSPTQIHGSGTNWSSVHGGYRTGMAIKTDGTLWAWGDNDDGTLGQNAPQNTHASSPAQVPGTTWKQASIGFNEAGAVKTDGTLWMWGSNQYGELGHNNTVFYSSPVQVSGTTWNEVSTGYDFTTATKTDGTLWAWGRNHSGYLGQNSIVDYSSPVQIGTETGWGSSQALRQFALAVQDDQTP